MFEVYKGKRVFVTGHTGFKGSWLCEMLLMAGAEVWGYALKPPTKPSLFAQLKLAKRIRSHVIGDVRDLKALTAAIRAAKPDFVFHLAAQPLVRESYRVPVETFETNVMGTVNVLEAVRRTFITTDFTDYTDCGRGDGQTTDFTDYTDCGRGNGQITDRKNDMCFKNPCNLCNPWFTKPTCSVVCITTDKCYENRETLRPYREDDPMGGYDPYSCSKGCDELLIASYRRSFFNGPDSPVWLASARAGNVIGGGDWAADRIVPDCMRALGRGERIAVRNKTSTRPWQHVLEPLAGYLTLGAALAERRNYELVAGGFNFGPDPKANRTVKDLVVEILKHRKGRWVDKSDPKALHEAGLLNLDIRKAKKVLGWKPRWNFEETIEKTVEWYEAVRTGKNAGEVTRRQIEAYVGCGRGIQPRITRISRIERVEGKTTDYTDFTD